MRTATMLLACSTLLAATACNKSAPASGASSQTAEATPAAPAAGPISPSALPHRKPGLWRQTMAMEGSQHEMPASEFCIDAASEAKMSMMGQQMSNCQAPQFSRNLDGSLSFSSACDVQGGGKMTSKGTISGDFNSSYKVAIETSSTGGPAGMDQSGRKMTVTATWEGPCAPDQKGGDIILPGGQKVNVLAGR